MELSHNMRIIPYLLRSTPRLGGQPLSRSIPRLEGESPLQIVATVTGNETCAPTNLPFRWEWTGTCGKRKAKSGKGHPESRSFDPADGKHVTAGLRKRAAQEDEVEGGAQWEARQRERDLQICRGVEIDASHASAPQPLVSPFQGRKIPGPELCHRRRSTGMATLKKKNDAGTDRREACVEGRESKGCDTAGLQGVDGPWAAASALALALFSDPEPGSSGLIPSQQQLPRIAASTTLSHRQSA
ncbi:uncharacterized protein PAN0_003d1843 [Moesziomyces antarcticus]|uniref:uncharacterized protein n=1 Tax=Pseudozyma antarctica TaxID=84753 RepID=UPI0007197C67|nr:uncharacterized protein PAN0_003d1843 [Moesziomyces antarcticus]GAK63637.1 hypothetical protein PAN0_003d1843 [Moesziomyces antarcticus]